MAILMPSFILFLKNNGGKPMKKILVIVVLLAFIVACAPEPASYEREEVKVDVPDQGDKETLKKTEGVQAKPETGRTPPAYTPPSEKITYEDPKKEETEEVSLEKKKLDPAIKDLLDRSETKVKSYSFLYRGPESNNVAKDTYYYLFKDSKLSKIKIKKYEEDYYIRANESTHIYASLQDNKAIGCCEVLSRCLSENVDNTNNAVEFALDEITLPRAPHEWLLEIPENATVRGTETLQGQTVTTITYTKNGYDWEMKINSVYGMPQLVISRANDEIVEEYQFDDCIYNDVRESDFVAPCLT
jgi:hypothetical protein